MTVSWLGAFLTFQVTFTELFIAATVILAVGYKHGWKSAAVGSLVGAAAIVLASAALAALGGRLPTRVLDWVSSLLLLGFGLFLLYGFWRSGPTSAPEADRPAEGVRAARSLSLAGVMVTIYGIYFLTQAVAAPHAIP